MTASAPGAIYDNSAQPTRWPNGPLLESHAVGDIVYRNEPTDPALVYGYGTWAMIGGKFLVGYLALDPDFGTVGATGGAKTKAISAHAGTAVADHLAHTHDVTSNVAVAAHTVTQPTIAWPAGVPTASGTAVADHAAHTHSVTATGTNSAPTFTGNAVTASASAVSPKLVTGNTSTGVSLTTTATGTVSAPTFTGSAATSGNPSATLTHAVTQPTIAWPGGVPTATGAAVSAHSVTNNTVTSTAPSATLSHVVTQPSDHTAVNVLPPFRVVYIWERTA